MSGRRPRAPPSSFTNDISVVSGQTQHTDPYSTSTDEGTRSEQLNLSRTVTPYSTFSRHQHDGNRWFRDSNYLATFRSDTYVVRAESSSGQDVFLYDGPGSVLPVPRSWLRPMPPFLGRYNVRWEPQYAAYFVHPLAVQLDGTRPVRARIMVDLDLDTHQTLLRDVLRERPRTPSPSPRGGGKWSLTPRKNGGSDGSGGRRRSAASTLSSILGLSSRPRHRSHTADNTSGTLVRAVAAFGSAPLFDTTEKVAPHVSPENDVSSDRSDDDTGIDGTEQPQLGGERKDTSLNRDNGEDDLDGFEAYVTVKEAADIILERLEQSFLANTHRPGTIPGADSTTENLDEAVGRIVPLLIRALDDRCEATQHWPASSSHSMTLSEAIKVLGEALLQSVEWHEYEVPKDHPSARPASYTEPQGPFPSHEADDQAMPEVKNDKALSSDSEVDDQALPRHLEKLNLSGDVPAAIHALPGIAASPDIRSMGGVLK